MKTQGQFIFLHTGEGEEMWLPIIEGASYTRTMTSVVVRHSDGKKAYEVRLGVSITPPPRNKPQKPEAGGWRSSLRPSGVTIDKGNPPNMSKDCPMANSKFEILNSNLPLRGNKLGMDSPHTDPPMKPGQDPGILIRMVSLTDSIVENAAKNLIERGKESKGNGKDATTVRMAEPFHVLEGQVNPCKLSDKGGGRHPEDRERKKEEGIGLALTNYEKEYMGKWYPDYNAISKPLFNFRRKNGRECEIVCAKCAKEVGQDGYMCPYCEVPHCSQYCWKRNWGHMKEMCGFFPRMARERYLTGDFGAEEGSDRMYGGQWRKWVKALVKVKKKVAVELEKRRNDNTRDDVTVATSETDDDSVD